MDLGVSREMGDISRHRWWSGGVGAFICVCVCVFGEFGNVCVCVCVEGDKHKALACGEDRKLLCVTESIGSLFTGRQLAMRTD